MKIVTQVYDCSAMRLAEKVIKSMAKCYADIFNKYWNENWTPEEAKKTIEKGLIFTGNRESRLCLLFDNEKVVGFAWIILSAVDAISTEDMPYELSETEKEYGVKVLRYWLNLVKQDKLLIYRELAIYGEYQNLNNIHMASELSLPLIKIAQDKGYKSLFYWSNPNNVTFKHGLGFRWFPIHYYVDNDKVIMVGEVKKFIYYLQGMLSKDKKKLAEMIRNRKEYLQS